MSVPASSQALTLAIPVRRADTGALERALRRSEEAIVAELAGARTTRYALLGALPARGGSAELLVETAFDGALAAHAAELARALGALLAEVGAVCGESPDALAAYAAARARRTSAFYLRGPGGSARAFRPPWTELAVIVGLSSLLELEARLGRPRAALPPVVTPPPNPGAELEPFCAAFPLRAGELRRRVLRRVLALAQAAFDDQAPAALWRGAGGLRALHAARFVVLEERLLVTALVDGPPNVFFDRLVETVAPALNAIFMHTQHFPPSTAVVFGGARRYAAFRRWLQSFQVPAFVGYGTRPELPVLRAPDARRASA